MTEQASRLRAIFGVAMVCGIILSLTSIAFGQNWPMGGQNLQNSRSQSVTTITPQNVGTLTQKWVFTTHGNVSATPAVYANTIYFPDFAGYFYAVNASNGALVWSRRVATWTGVTRDYARNDPAIDGNTLILGDQAGANAKWTATGGLTGAGARVIAVNRKTGALKWSTQVETFPAAMVTGSPVISNGVVYVGVASAEESVAATNGYPCCVSSGSVVALSEATGQKLWQTYMAPSGYSGASVWGSTPVIDTVRNQLYVGTGNNFSAPQVVETCYANNQSNPNCAASNDYSIPSSPLI
jgi:polyvinyl alcohol dehydrogenase (cytochrome)